MHCFILFGYTYTYFAFIFFNLILFIRTFCWASVSAVVVSLPWHPLSIYPTELFSYSAPLSFSGIGKYIFYVLPKEKQWNKNKIIFHLNYPQLFCKWQRVNLDPWICSAELVMPNIWWPSFTDADASHDVNTWPWRRRCAVEFFYGRGAKKIEEKQKFARDGSMFRLMIGIFFKTSLNSL